MPEQVEQQICTKFCIKLEHSSAEISWMSRRPQLWATGDWQLHHNSMPAHASHLMQSFLMKHQITQVTQPLYSPVLAPCDFWLFPKLKSPLKRKRFQIVDEIQENTMGQLMVTGRTVWGPKVPTLKGPEASLFLCRMFLETCIFFNKCLYFHITWLNTFWTDLIYVYVYVPHTCINRGL